MGDVYREAGRAAEGLATVAQGLDKVERSGERFFEAELYRARGDLLAAMIEAGGQDAGSVNGPLWTPDHDEAEASFLRAITIAQQRGAKSHELRAAISLSRLMAKQGKGDDARKMLVELLNWFSEGFDTYDLKTARALITELA
jgi:predicted ATPase